MGTKSLPPGVVTAATKRTTACLVRPSFQEGSGSAAWSAETGAEVGAGAGAGTAMLATGGASGGRGWQRRGARAGVEEEHDR